MSKKKRVYELAKELGMTGQDLAAKLRDLGFSEVKSHMTAMDEFLLLRVQGTLEAHGVVAESRAGQAESVLQSGGLTVRKRKKEAQPTVRAAAPAPVEEDLDEEAPEAGDEQGEVDLRARADELEPVALIAEEPLETEREEQRPARLEHAPAFELEDEAFESELAPAEAAAQLAELEPDLLEDEEAPEWTGRTAAAPEDEALEAPLESTAALGKLPAGDDIMRPSAKRRPGKVVGFVDLSKLQAAPVRKTESRRLRSKDDITPDVKPTLGHDRKRAFVRGDHASRGSLTAGQLREKEAGRFLRHRRPLGGGAASGARGAGRTGLRGRQVDPLGSPHTGGEIVLDAPVTIKKLAEGLSLKVNQLLPKAASLLGWGITNNTILDEESATLLAHEFDVELRLVQKIEAEEALLKDLGLQRSKVADSQLAHRPPVIAFLGHVDHGKTTLLDTIRDSRVTKGEAGGITQHIGAYQVHTKSGHTVTILDTPGHEAFTAMRARGAQATDIVVLVVAADDGVMPSTIEAINHVKVANEEAARQGRDRTPIVVALNKMDKPEANPDKVRTELAQRGLNPEEWGGDTAMVEISALKGTGVDGLLERVFLESEVLEHLRAHPNGPAEGLVLEAEIQEGKGKVAYLLVQDGTLKQGDIILAGEGYGRVRSIHDDRGNAIKAAGPSAAIEVSGLSELPTVGEKFHVVGKLEQAKEVAEERARKNRQQSLAERRAVTMENLQVTMEAERREMINVIVKADVQGSLQAIVQQLENLKHAEVEVKILHSALGAVTESDVDLARSAGSQGRIIAFNVGVQAKARVAAERGGVEIRHYSVIYELLDELRLIMEGTLAPEFQEQITGHAEVRRLFKSSKFGNIAGCVVLDGTLNRNNKVRVLRAGELVHSGALSTIRREKDEVKEVREGFECGITVKDFDAFQEGDVIETYKLVEVKRLLKI